MSLVVFLLALVLLLAPLVSGIPDEPRYSSWLCAAVMLAVLIAVSRAGRGLWSREGPPPARRAETAFAALLGIALLSLLLRMSLEHGVAYLGPMLRGWTLLATDFTVFVLARRVAQAGRVPAYALILTAVFSSAIVAMSGVTEYLTHRRAGDVGWRVFATSTPDFLAGYLVMLLPITLSLFLALPLQKQRRPLIGFALAVLLMVVLAYQAATLLWTQSRFGVISVTVGVLALLASLWRAKRAGLALERSSWGRLGGIVVCLGLIGLAFAKPLATRLRHSSVGDNSTAFRLYTWRGSLHMAAANPVLGTGIGTYVHVYPRYAITGFTRLAHESYLQMADECGLPGLLALLLTLGFTFAAVGRGINPPESASRNQPDRLLVPRIGGGGGNPGAGEFLAAVAPADDRVLLCGLLGGLAAAAVQNLIDSDWYVFFLGVTFWALAGLAAGLALPQGDIWDGTPTPPELGTGRRSTPSELGGKRRVALAVGAALILVRMAAQGLAATEDQQASAALGSPAADAAPTAEQAWSEARAWDPLNARYQTELGNQVYFGREGRLADAARALRDAVRLEPSSLNAASLATILAREHRYGDAIRALQDGLKSDPNSLDLRLLLAQLLPPPQSIDYLRQITVLEDSPVGRVRAIGNITEYKFAIADAGVADATPDPAEAQRDYRRAARLLESYANEGGTTNIQRMVLIGDHPNPALDDQMHRLYDHVMGRLLALTPPAERPPLRSRATFYDRKYTNVVNQASQPGTL